MPKTIVLASAVVCFALGAYLLVSMVETAGMAFMIAGCIGVIVWATEA